MSYDVQEMNTTTNNEKNVLDTPLIVILEQYLATASQDERDILSGVLLDTRNEHEAILSQIQECEAEYSGLSSYKSDGTEEGRRAYKESERCRDGLWIQIRELTDEAQKNSPLSLEMIADGVRDKWGHLNDFYEDQARTRNYSLMLERGFINHPQYVGFGQCEPVLWGREHFERVRKGELLLHEIIRSFLSNNEFSDERLEYLLSLRKRLVDYFRSDETSLRVRLSEFVTFSDLAARVKHFAQSRVRDEYFEKALSLAKTKEELYFVVRHGTRCACWPKAVRRLAKLKDLSPFERKR